VNSLSAVGVYADLGKSWNWELEISVPGKSWKTRVLEKPSNSDLESRNLSFLP